ncbi:MAG: hypothetical protein K6V97_15000 [Actinomycetia bacterium]|nr:hypothetical protein [Actinomycetes bacterium]
MVGPSLGWGLGDLADRPAMQVLRTTEGGHRWTVVTPPGLTAGTWAVCALPGQPAAAWLAGAVPGVAATVYRTTTGGDPEPQSGDPDALRRPVRRVALPLPTETGVF